MISLAGVCQPVEDRTGVFRKGPPTGRAAVALKALGGPAVLDDVARIGFPSV